MDGVDGDHWCRGSRTVQGSGKKSSRPAQKKSSASEASEKRNVVCVDDPAESRS